MFKFTIKHPVFHFVFQILCNGRNPVINPIDSALLCDGWWFVIWSWRQLLPEEI